jgi:hypothetical protein
MQSGTYLTKSEKKLEIKGPRATGYEPLITWSPVFERNVSPPSSGYESAEPCNPEDLSQHFHRCENFIPQYTGLVSEKEKEHDDLVDIASVFLARTLLDLHYVRPRAASKFFHELHASLRPNKFK